MATKKNNQQHNNKDNLTSYAGTTLPNEGMKNLQDSPIFQRKQAEHGVSSSNSQSNNSNTQNKSSKSSSMRSNNSNKQNQSSPARTSKTQYDSRLDPKVFNFQDTVKNELQNKRTSTSQQEQLKDKSSGQGPTKKSKMKKVLDKFTNIIKHPTKTIKSSLGMKNNKKTTSHVDKLNNERNNMKNDKSTRNR